MKIVFLFMACFALMMLGCASGPQYVYVSQGTPALTALNVHCLTRYNNVLDKTVGLALNLAFSGVQTVELLIDGGKVETCRKAEKKLFIPVSPGTHKFTLRSVEHPLGIRNVNNEISYIFRIKEGEVGTVEINQSSHSTATFDNISYWYEEGKDK